jgi:hypothetical protein
MKKKVRDAFPATGPVAEYKPRILVVARQFSQRYYLPFWLVLREAIAIAVECEPKYDRQRGTKFGTMLEKHLLGLHQICQEHYRFRYVNEPPKTELEPWQKEQRKRERTRLRQEFSGWGGRKGFGLIDRLSGIKPAGSTYAKWKMGFGPDKWPQLARAARKARRGLKKEERAMLDWIIGDLSLTETRTMKQAAAEIGITPARATGILRELAQDIENIFRRDNKGLA